MIWKSHIDMLQLMDKISASTADKLKQMVSGSPESLSMMKTIIKSNLAGILQEGLNDKQKEIFDSIIDYLDDAESYDAVMINGYAGTGKTFLARRIIEYISACFDGKLCVTAPTNKAVKVLNEGRKSVFLEECKSSSPVIYCTTHKYLGLKEIVDDEGNISFKPSGQIMDDCRYLIIDEASMINKNIAEMIMLNPNVKVIMLGDPCQIPPVGEDKCIFFKENNWKIHTVVLDEIIRQKKGNPIISKSIEIRENITSKDPVKLKTKIGKNGCVVFTSDKKDVVECIKKNISDCEYLTDSTMFKIIAWRNDTIDYLNGYCRKLLFGENADRFVRNEKLIANNTISNQNKFGSFTPIINTSQEMIIKDVAVIDRNLKFMNEVYKRYENLDIKAYALVVELDNGNEEVIHVLHESEKYRWLKYMSDMKKECIKKNDARLWVNYYNIGKYFADVNYAYAITAHKSQGSTYKNCVVMFNDIDCNHKIEERNKIKYTSMTRASNNIMILC